MSTPLADTVAVRRGTLVAFALIAALAVMAILDPRANAERARRDQKREVAELQERAGALRAQLETLDRERTKLPRQRGEPSSRVLVCY